jgi:polysaccharide pyruvyl transferase
MLGRRRLIAGRRAPKGPAQLGPRVALWGAFDLPDYGNLLLPRIFERELRSRLPLAQVVAYSPLGYDHPIPMDGGRPALSLGAPEHRRKKELAAQYDLVVVVGDVIHTHDQLYADRYGIGREDARRLRPSGFFVDGLGAELAQRCPIVWHAVQVPFVFEQRERERIAKAVRSVHRVSVSDPTSRDRLEQATAERQFCIVPDPTILISRLFDVEVLRKRRDYLRVLDCYPADKAPILIQGDASLADRASEIASAIRKVSDPGDELVLVELSETRGDRLFANAIAGHLPGVRRLPESASLEDITAAIANARAFVAAAPQGRSAALAFGAPTAPLTADPTLVFPDGMKEPNPVPLQEEADASLDELAEIAERSWSARVAADGHTPIELALALREADERYELLLRAHEARGHRLVTERLKFAEIIDRLEEPDGPLDAETAHRIAELENAVFTAQADEAEARHELERLREERDRSV